MDIAISNQPRHPDNVPTSGNRHQPATYYGDLCLKVEALDFELFHSREMAQN